MISIEVARSIRPALWQFPPKAATTSCVAIFDCRHLPQCLPTPNLCQRIGCQYRQPVRKEQNPPSETMPHPSLATKNTVNTPAPSPVPAHLFGSNLVPIGSSEPSVNSTEWPCLRTVWKTVVFRWAQSNYSRALRSHGSIYGTSSISPTFYCTQTTPMWHQRTYHGGWGRIHTSEAMHE